MGDGEKAPLLLKFNPKIQLESRGAAITSDAGLLVPVLLSSMSNRSD